MGVRIGRMKFRRVVVDNTPPAPRRTTIITTTEDGTQEFLIEGTLDRQWMIDNGFYAGYNWLKNITLVDIGTSVTSIGYAAFLSCSNLTGVTIPNSVTSIGESAFESTGLTSIILPNSITNIGEFAFYECIGLTGTLILPNSVIIIDRSAFENCDGLTGLLTIPNNVTSVGLSVFRNCRGLTSIKIGSGITKVSFRMFGGCSNCTIFDFSDALSVPSLGNVNAFASTPANKKIIVPDALYNSWIAASNWSSTTNGIVTSIVRASDFNN